MKKEVFTEVDKSPEEAVSIQAKLLEDKEQE